MKSEMISRAFVAVKHKSLELVSPVSLDSFMFGLKWYRHSQVIFMPSSLFSLEPKHSAAIPTTRLKSGELRGTLALT